MDKIQGVEPAHCLDGRTATGNGAAMGHDAKNAHDVLDIRGHVRAIDERIPQQMEGLLLH
jgi:hypothetical protein